MQRATNLINQRIQRHRSASLGGFSAGLFWATAATGGILLAGLSALTGG